MWLVSRLYYGRVNIVESLSWRGLLQILLTRSLNYFVFYLLIFFFFAFFRCSLRVCQPVRPQCFHLGLTRILRREFTMTFIIRAFELHERIVHTGPFYLEYNGFIAYIACLTNEHYVQYIKKVTSSDAVIMTWNV